MKTQYPSLLLSILMGSTVVSASQAAPTFTPAAVVTLADGTVHPVTEFAFYY